MTEAEAERRIADGLAESGLAEGTAVLVHSSLSSLGWVSGGPETVIRGLLRAIGPAGTLLMSGLTHGRVTPDQPVFDVLNTPTGVGAIPEHFRTREGTTRGIHPTHSICGVGGDVARYMGDHQKDDTPCGPNSPYRRLRDLGGQVMFVGCGMGPNTSMHGVEEIAEAPYVFGGVVDYQVIMPDGTRRGQRSWRHGFQGWRQRYDRLEPLVPSEGLKVGKVLRATVHILESQVMWEVALEAMRRDPYHFVERH